MEELDRMIVLNGLKYNELQVHPIYKEGILESKRQLFDQLCATTLSESSERENIYNVIKAFEVLENTVGNIVNEGVSVQDYYDRLEEVEDQ